MKFKMATSSELNMMTNRQLKNYHLRERRALTKLHEEDMAIREAEKKRAEIEENELSWKNTLKSSDELHQEKNELARLRVLYVYERDTKKCVARICNHFIDNPEDRAVDIFFKYFDGLEYGYTDNINNVQNATSARYL